MRAIVSIKRKVGLREPKAKAPLDGCKVLNGHKAFLHAVRQSDEQPKKITHDERQPDL
jgi:hypothetical protein